MDVSRWVELHFLARMLENSNGTPVSFAVPTWARESLTSTVAELRARVTEVISEACAAAALSSADLQVIEAVALGCGDRNTCLFDAALAATTTFRLVAGLVKALPRVSDAHLIVNVERGWTLLHAAAFSSNASLIRFLCLIGVDPDKQCIAGYTALHYVSMHGSVEAFLELYAAGACVHILDRVRRIPSLIMRRLRVPFARLPVAAFCGCLRLDSRLVLCLYHRADAVPFKSRALVTVLMCWLLLRAWTCLKTLADAAAIGSAVLF